VKNDKPAPKKAGFFYARCIRDTNKNNGGILMRRLKQKVALVTGAAQGIGKSIAEVFHQQGAKVILSDINDSLGRKTADALQRSDYIHLDVSEEDDWQRAFDYIKNNYNRLDILVNNAGISGYLQTQGPHDPEFLDLASWRQVHAVNSDGTALGCKYAIQLMKEFHSGSIVNISSRAGIVGIPYMTAYAASKAAVRNHTKSVALYCAEKNYGIRCNSIHPGAILTPMWDPMFGEGEQRDAMIAAIAQQVPLGEMGSPVEVANAALYLASDESKYVTGIELHIDGGILAGSAATPAITRESL
jgi:3(or 17)beta-hydroxysteroid dehydrogenase